MLVDIYIYKEPIDKRSIYRIQRMVGLSGMTFIERLWEIGLMDGFEEQRKK